MGKYKDTNSGLKIPSHLQMSNAPIVGKKATSPPVVQNHHIGQYGKTITPTEVSRLAFYPCGPRLLVEPIQAHTVNESGNIIVQEKIDKPIYRVLRFGEKMFMNSEILNRVHVGDIVFSKTLGMVPTYHNLPRKEDGSERMLFMLDSSLIHGIWSNMGLGWSEKEQEESLMENFDASCNFTDEQLSSLGGMMTEEDASKIKLSPLGHNIIVEHAPLKTMSSGGIHLGEAQRTPLFRIVKMPDPVPESFPRPFVKAGDLVLLNQVLETDEIPHNLRDSKDRKRKLYMVDAGLIQAFYKGFGWDSQVWQSVKNIEIEVGDQVNVSEGVGP